MSQPEPCISGRCLSPMACGGFGYCRDRNHYGMPDAETAERWRNIAAKMLLLPPDKDDIGKRLGDVIAGWPAALPANAFVQVRADLISGAFNEIEVLRAEKFKAKTGAAK